MSEKNKPTPAPRKLSAIPTDSDRNPLHPAASRADLEAECDVIPYTELQKFFAKGMLVTVDPGMNLVDVALSLAADDAAQLKQWAEAGLVQRAHDKHARTWHANNALLRTVTVTPWILVQDTAETVPREPTDQGMKPE